MIKKIIALIIVLCLSIPVFAIDINISADDKVINVNKVWQLFYNEIGIDNLCGTTKELEDVLGNKYILGECYNTGYFIYHIDSGIFVEYSIEAPSPYINMDGTLLYFGPTEYYVVSNTNKLIHTVTKENISISSANLEKLRRTSSTINSELIAN